MPLHFRDATLADADALARILVPATRSAFAGLVPERCLSWLPDGVDGTLAEHEARSAANWRESLAHGADPDQIFLLAVADDGEAVGYVQALPIADPGFRGEIGQLCVRLEYQKRGVGRALVREAARRLAARGVHSLRVGVLSINPNRAFYERLGGRPLFERDRDWDGTTFLERFYGWENTAALL